MKKTIIGALLIFALIFSNLGLGYSNKAYAQTPVKADPEKFFLIFEELEDSSSYYHKVHEISEYKYNEFGEETEYTNKTGDYAITVLNEYTPNGIIKKKTFIKNDGTTDIDFYDENGEIYSRIYYENDKFKSFDFKFIPELMDEEIFTKKLYKDKYDKEGKLVSRTYTNTICVGIDQLYTIENGKVTEKYDKNERLVKVTKEGKRNNSLYSETHAYTYFKSGIKKSDIYTLSCDGNVIEKNETYYNEFGDIIKSIQNNRYRKDYKKTYTYTKDNKGRNIKVIMEIDDYTTTEEYKYDSAGNIINKSTVEWSIKYNREYSSEILKYKYDKNNRLTFDYKRYQNNWGDVTEETKTYKYNKSGLLEDYKIVTTKTSSDGQIDETSHEEKYKYYKSGQQKLVKIYNDGYLDESYSFDSKGHYTSICTYNSKGVVSKGEEWTYDSKGRVTGHITINGNSKTVSSLPKQISDKSFSISNSDTYYNLDEERYQNDKLIYSLKWTYAKNNDGTITATSKIDNNGKKYTGSISVYNKYLDLIKETSYDASGSVSYESTYNIKYDSNGKMVSKTETVNSKEFTRWTYDKYGNVILKEQGTGTKVSSKTTYKWERLKNIIK